MLVIAILGGVASGKSLVAQQLASLGAGLLDADRIGHEVLKQSEVIAVIREHFGPSVMGPDGEVDRSALARRVFAPPPAGPAELAFLEGITHPLIEQRLRQRTERLAADGVKVAVLDAPVMLKAGWHRMCDMIWFVDTPLEVRKARALARGWTEAEFNRREAAQESIHTKRSFADVTIDNSTSPEAVRTQVEQFWSELNETP